jgi:hypothetical protein
MLGSCGEQGAIKVSRSANEPFPLGGHRLAQIGRYPPNAPRYKWRLNVGDAGSDRISESHIPFVDKYVLPDRETNGRPRFAVSHTVPVQGLIVADHEVTRNGLMLSTVMVTVVGHPPNAAVQQGKYRKNALQCV